MKFTEKLKLARLNKSELSNKTGRSKSHISTWGENPPKYIDAYLDKCIECENLKIIVESLKKGVDFLK